MKIGNGKRTSAKSSRFFASSQSRPAVTAWSLFAEHARKKLESTAVGDYLRPVQERKVDGKCIEHPAVWVPPQKSALS